MRLVGGMHHIGQGSASSEVLFPPSIDERSTSSLYQSNSHGGLTHYEIYLKGYWTRPRGYLILKRNPLSSFLGMSLHLCMSSSWSRCSSRSNWVPSILVVSLYCGVIHSIFCLICKILTSTSAFTIGMMPKELELVQHAAQKKKMAMVGPPAPKWGWIEAIQAQPTADSPCTLGWGVTPKSGAPTYIQVPNYQPTLGGHLEDPIPNASDLFFFFPLRWSRTLEFIMLFSSPRPFIDTSPQSTPIEFGQGANEVRP